jgi:hypothetical protein
MNCFRLREPLLLSVLLLVISLPVSATPPAKVELCHYDRTNGTWSLISVKEKAVAQHLAHGDGEPGEAVPGMNGYTFSATCQPTPAALTITYVNDLLLHPDLQPSQTLALNQAPVDVDDPLYDPADPDTQWLFTDGSPAYSAFDPAGLVATGPDFLPTAIKLDQDSLVSRYGIGTSQQMIRFLGVRNTLFTFSLTNRNLLSQASVPLNFVFSLAARDRNLVTVIADNSGVPFGYSIDALTGWPTEAFGFDGDGDAPGQFRDALHHTYGPDGLLYVLDYGNGRVQSLDPDNLFAPVAQFPLEAGATTANMPFAIDGSGRIFLGDGLGGGSAYSQSGVFLGSFALPVDHSSTPVANINPYLATDQSGHLYVFGDTGLHQYLVQ